MNRVSLPHDFDTMINDAEQLIIRGEPMSEAILVPQTLHIGRAIEDLQLVIECYSQSEMHIRIRFLPL